MSIERLSRSESHALATRAAAGSSGTLEAVLAALTGHSNGQVDAPFAPAHLDSHTGLLTTSSTRELGVAA